MESIFNFRLNRIRSGIVIFILISFFTSFSTQAQSDQDLVNVANEMYKFGDVKDALEIYKQAVEINPTNAFANYMVGKCYLETIHKEQSLPYLVSAYEMDDRIAFNILYMIATSYHLGYNFDKAIEYYEKYRTKLLNEREDENFKTADELKKIERRIEECRNGLEFIKNPTHSKIENMGKEVNSVYQDYAPVISADQTMLFFTSRREGSSEGIKANDNEYYEDIYMSKKVDGQWTKAQNIGPTINTKLHEASIGLSPDGKTLFIYKDDNKNPGDIFMCSIDSKGKWSKAVSIGSEINTEYIENSVNISKDGQTLLFASNRPDGKGGMDIYISRKQKNGKWGKPENMGDVINTEYDDEGPFLDSDGKTVFFSSKGHKGMGGFDIYKSVYDSVRHRWGEPKNLGFPINSPDDDIYFVISGDDQIAYYASVKDDGLDKEGIGDVDLFKIILEAKIPTDSIKPPHAITLEDFRKVTVQLHSVELLLDILAEADYTPIDGVKIEIYDTKSKTIFTKGLSKNGKFEYSFSDKEEKHYLITLSKEGYVYHKEEVIVPAGHENGTKVEKRILLDKIQVGNRYILRNIYYDFDKATLKPESYTELNKLYNFLKENPKMKIEIDGHTDSKGSMEYNQTLSQNRALSVRNYLIKKGIPSDRIVSKGFGKTHPLASNDDEEEGRELNRRTEFVILAK